ncbi:helix-turn-helix domain-containing protein [Salinirubellus salinus]|uniref:Helix-turn-helix domain-containing protein n=1 Tax=Salinirubellus salinus TaxID=1364945 RepID=A0A9E7U4Q7_9EURY|nr:helix-turn-helix domain-containing protein [Salinirubellus salinus]UWM54585.1 helix-turn-helix domain-containing protein [Salinirubellus salinus]
MVITAHVYAEHENLVLSPTIRSLRDVEVSVVSDAGTDPENDVHFFRFEADDFGALERALADDRTVAAFSTILDEGDRRTYRVEYSDAAKRVAPPLTEIGGLIRDVRSHLDGWRLELRFQTHDGVYQLDEYARAEGISLDVLELTHTDGREDRSDFGLTEEQREALVAAYVHGYYDDPRETPLEGLAALLDISPTAVSGRLRRGSARLVEEVLLDENGDEK